MRQEGGPDCGGDEAGKAGLEMKEYREDKSIQGRKEEIAIKVKRLQEAMERLKLDAVIINKSNNFAWITAGASNIITRYSEEGVTSIVITKEGGQYILANNIEYPRIVKEETIEELGFEIKTCYWFEDRNLDFVKEIVGEGRYGADIAFPGAENANAMIEACQYSLTENDIARYQYLGDTFSKALEECLTQVRPGDVELDIAGRINEALWKYDIDPVLFLVAGDERILDFRHCIPTANKIKKRMMVSCNGRYKGLVTKTTRFVNFGEPEETFMKQYLDTLDIENQMMAVTTAGTDDIVPHRLAKELYAQKGYPEMWKVHHQGGPQGYSNGYYLVTEDRHGIIQPNQCYCYNPSITGTKTEDGFIVTEEGPLMITKPVVFPAVEAQVGGVTVRRPGVLVIE